MNFYFFLEKKNPIFQKDNAIAILLKEKEMRKIKIKKKKRKKFHKLRINCD